MSKQRTMAKTTIQQRNRLDWLAMDNSPLVDMLPHGSGIDAKWDISQLVNHNVVCSCSYHGMDAHGYYDGWQDFKIVIHPIAYVTICPLCNGRRYRTIEEIAEIRRVDVGQLDKDGLRVDWIDDARTMFDCNECRGQAYNPQILDFRFSFVGGLVRRSWTCGLRDYLVDTIHNALSDYLFQTIKVS